MKKYLRDLVAANAVLLLIGLGLVLCAFYSYKTTSECVEMTMQYTSESPDPTTPQEGKSFFNMCKHFRGL